MLIKLLLAVIFSLLAKSRKSAMKYRVSITTLLGNISY
jgi:hypothetical protein